MSFPTRTPKVDELVVGSKGYVRPSAIKIDRSGKFWLDPLAPIVFYNVVAHGFGGEPPTEIKVTRTEDGYFFEKRRDEIEFDVLDDPPPEVLKRGGFIPVEYQSERHR